MEPINYIRGSLMPLGLDDVDTDQIIPKQFLNRVERTGFGDFLFYNWRQDPQCVFNDARFFGASVLVAGRNFGCGSSREHAVWALRQYGFRAVVAPSFSDIFSGNSVQDGLVTVVADEADCAELLQLATTNSTAQIEIDLDRLQLRWNGRSVGFEMDPRVRESLVLGLDDISLILRAEDKIRSFEQSRPGWMPEVDPRAVR
jgi:3-isopropylmalate/(R)-2-methylmalate dehydratase small subunit